MLLKLRICLSFLLLDLPLFITLFFIFLVVFIIVTVYKRILLFAAYYVAGRKLIPFDGLKPCDTFLLRCDLNKIATKANKRRNKCNIANQEETLLNAAGFVCKFEGEPIELENIRNLWYEKFFNEKNINPPAKYLNLQVKVVKFGGYVFKEKVELIDLKNQIYSVDISDSTTIEEYFADWYVQPFLPSSNGLLWEVVLINSSQNAAENSSYIAFKFHHCIADGYTGIHMLDRVCGNETKYIVGNVTTSAWADIYTNIRAPRAWFRHFSKLDDIEKLRIPISPNNIRTRLSFGSLELKKVKEIKARYQVQCQCVLKSLLVSAIRQLYLCNGLKIPQSAVFVGSLPWPGHPFKERMTNWSSPFALDLRISETNPTNRLSDIRGQFNRYHNDGLSRSMVQVLGPVLDLIPHFLYNCVPAQKATANISALLAGDDYNLLGRRITKMHIIAGLQMDLALFGTWCSYGDKVDYTIIANRQLISQEDLDKITKILIPAELDKMYAS